MYDKRALGSPSPSGAWGVAGDAAGAEGSRAQHAARGVGTSVSTSVRTCSVAPVPGAVRSPVHGEAGTGDGRCAKRERDTDAAVRPLPMNLVSRRRPGTRR